MAKEQSLPEEKLQLAPGLRGAALCLLPSSLVVPVGCRNPCSSLLPHNYWFLPANRGTEGQGRKLVARLHPCTHNTHK